LTIVDDFGQLNDWSWLWLVITILSQAITNIFNRKFVNQTKIPILQFSFFAYCFALLATCVIYVVESFIQFKGIHYPLFTLHGLARAEEVSNILLMNQLNEVANYVLMIYLAQKTFITRASVYGVVSTLYVIGEGVYAGRMGQGTIYFTLGTWLEIVLFLSSYALIFFERIKNRNIARFKKRLETTFTKYLEHHEDLTK